MKFPEFTVLQGKVTVEGRKFAVLMVPAEHVWLFAALAKTIETVGPDSTIVTFDECAALRADSPETER